MASRLLSQSGSGGESDCWKVVPNPCDAQGWPDPGYGDVEPINNPLDRFTAWPGVPLSTTLKPGTTS
jgi:hypothetical protein